MVLERNTKEPENWHSFGAIGLWSLGSFHAIYWRRWSHSTLLSLRDGLSISVCFTCEYMSVLLVNIYVLYIYFVFLL